MIVDKGTANAMFDGILGNLKDFIPENIHTYQEYYSFGKTFSKEHGFNIGQENLILQKLRLIYLES